MRYLYINLNILFLLAFYIEAISSEISLPLLYNPQDFDVLHYDATIEFSNEQRRLIFANNVITIFWKNRNKDSRFYFHLRSLSVDKVEYNGVMLDNKLVGLPSDYFYHYEITPPEEDTKDTANIKIYYHAIMQNEGGMNPWGGVHDKDVIFALGVGFYSNYVSTTQHWLACYDHPSDKATFKFTFINPLNKFIVSNGFGSKTQINGKDAFIYSSDIPIATYLMTFADYNYVEHNIDYKIPIKIYAAEKHSNSVPIVFSKLPKVVDAFEELFGEYPFPLIGYVLTPIGSMESQMMINLDEAVFENAAKNNDSLNLTIVHELSHQWFGNSVTPYDFRDAYLNEAWATYCESLLLEKLFDKSHYIKEQENKFNSYVYKIAPYEGYLPLYNFSRIPPSSNYPGTIYHKGAVVLGMLRYLITEGKDDTRFFNFIKEYLSEYKYKNVSTGDFINMVLKYKNDTAAVNRFFDSWVYKFGYPQFDIQLIRNDNAGNARYKDIAIRQYNPKSWGLFDQIPIPLKFIVDKQELDTVIWLEKGSADFIYLSDMLKMDKIFFDTVYFNAGNTLRSLFTISSIKIFEPNIVADNNSQINYSISYKQLKIKTSALNENNNIYIYDIYGRMVNKFIYDNSELINIDLSNLPSGFYNFVIMKNSNLIYKNKFILN